MHAYVANATNTAAIVTARDSAAAQKVAGGSDVGRPSGREDHTCPSTGSGVGRSGHPFRSHRGFFVTPSAPKDSCNALRATAESRLNIWHSVLRYLSFRTRFACYRTREFMEKICPAPGSILCSAGELESCCVGSRVGGSNLANDKMAVQYAVSA